MGYTGKPSRGCAVCRKRKIKCDERTGDCSYCIKTKQQCPGYKDSFDIAWRDQTTTARNNVERRMKAIAKQRSAEKSLLEPRSSSSIRRAPLSAEFFTWKTIPTCLTQETEDYAISFYFTSYGRPSANYDERLCGFQDIILPIFSSSPDGSALKLSTMAIATLFFNTWRAPQPENPLSRSYYIKALSVINQQLKEKDQYTTDETILAVLILQLFEKLVDRPRKFHATTAEARAHTDGALALIKHRGIHNFTDSFSQGLVAEIRSQLIELSFADAKPLDNDVGSWASILDNEQQPPGFRLDTIIVDLANLQATIKHSNTFGHKFQDTELLAQALDIDQRLQNWEESLPISWLPSHVYGPSCIAPSIVAAGVYQSHCTVHCSLSVSGIWNRYYSSRIRVLTILQTFLPSEIMYHQQIQQLVDNICAVVPFHLGDRMETSELGNKSVRYPTIRGEKLADEHYIIASAKGGIILLEPLGLLMGRTDLREGQREWIGGQIKRIYKLYRLGS